jgi:hypothetical protein
MHFFFRHYDFTLVGDTNAPTQTSETNPDQTTNVSNHLS